MISGHGKSVMKVFRTSSRINKTLERATFQEFFMALEDVQEKAFADVMKELSRPTILALYDLEAETKVTADT